jgi:hypothetical protein
LFAGKEIDFEEFLDFLRNGLEMSNFEANKKLFKDKLIEREVVIDPNESWGDFIKSVVLLEDAKVVPIRTLSATDLGRLRNPSKIKKWVNWRNCNYVEGRTDPN